MAKKSKTIYICQECGNVQPKWTGKCPECGAWNSFAEEKSVPKAKRAAPAVQQPLTPLTDKRSQTKQRLVSGISEFDRVVGGGLVKGSVVLLGGEPGIGKSTLMLQILTCMQGDHLLYFSGEESEEQIQIRAERLQIQNDHIYVTCENNLEHILAHIDQNHPEMVVVDSIQTLYSEEFENVPGSVTQVRECAGQLLRKAKTLGIIVVLVGHITKSGMLAGPKVLEHLVDTVLYLEGGKQNYYRTLRSIKNRFGSTNEIGVFEMKSKGLVPVGNPTNFFLMERREHVAGSAVAVSMEGTRPFLVEVQALITQTSYGNPQRTANGVDYRRLAMLIAVLEKRAGLPMGTQDVFVNLAGGLRVDETAINLGVIAAMASSFKDIPLAAKAVFIGEVGLVGEIRSVPFVEQRAREAVKFGYKKIYTPQSNLKVLKKSVDAQLFGVDSINHLFSLIFSGRKEV